MDDALCGLTRDDKGKLSFKADIPVHADAVRRHGLLTDELKMIGRMITSLQPALQLEEGGITDSEARRFTDQPKRERREKAGVAPVPV